MDNSSIPQDPNEKERHGSPPIEITAGNCFVLINPRKIEERRTFCVLGSPRGGTSMVAGLLRLFGVFMGERLDQDNNEDQDFIVHGGRRDLFQQSGPEVRREFLRQTTARFAGWSPEPESETPKSVCLGKIREVIRSRNRTYPLWGWKDPISILYIREIEDELVNPCYLAIYRDALAVTLGEHRKNNARPLVALETISDAYVRLTAFIRETRSPVLCISYEKALQNPRELVAELGRLTGADPDVGEVDRLSAYIEPNRNTGRIGLTS